jgi:hypothetical protein
VGVVVRLSVSVGCNVVVGVRKEGCKRRPEVTYRMRGLLRWRHGNVATEGVEGGRASSEVRVKSEVK